MARFLTWMASFMTWVASFLVMETLWSCIGFMRTTWKDKRTRQGRMEHCKKTLCVGIERLEESLETMESSLEMEVLNRKQCVHLFGKAIQVSKEVATILSLVVEELEFDYICEELCCLQEKVAMMGRSCLDRDGWGHAIMLQLQNKEAFRELIYDLKCCYDTIRHKFEVSYPNEAHDIANVQFDVALFEDVQEDEQVMKRWLEHLLREGKEERGIVEYALWRLRNLERVDGGDLDALEVMDDFIPPTIFKSIGGGRFGEVYETNWLGLPSATKVLECDAEYLINVRKEVGILAGLSHPNLVQFFGCGMNRDIGGQGAEGEGTFKMYLVMERMAMSLADVLKEAKGPLPYHLAIDMMLQIARGMYYLHDMQVAHLDLKPDNVLCGPMTGRDFDPCRVFKLTDYGTSRLEVSSKLKYAEQTKYTIGTPRYMAPEMYRKSGAPLYPFQADTWTFGMTCSEILSRKVPYHELEPIDIYKEIEDMTRVTGGCLRPELPNNCEELTELIQECWAPEPCMRPTFLSICERLTRLKREFLMGRRSFNMIPKYGWSGVKSVPKAIINHATKVDEPKVLPNDMVLEDSKRLLLKRINLKNVGYVGIVGMGGIGKTTLAKAIFDDVEVQSAYQARCFLAQVKDYQDSHVVLCKILQELGCEGEPKDLEQAQKMMEVLAKKKVLLVLDDIKDEAQVQDVVPLDVVHASKGTTVVLTTRDWGAIRAFVREEGRFEVETLDKPAATKLFTTHLSWSGDLLTSDFADLVKHIVRACNGLPLSLKVMGAFLHKKEKVRSWERALLRMERGKSLDGDGEVWNILQVSFDGLNNDMEKKMFLDMACFFCGDVYRGGISKERALHVWAQDNVLPVRELERLIEVSLVKVDKDGELLEMHDHLRDMGRKIAMERHAGTRIWKASMIPEGGLSMENAAKVEGISWRGSLDHLSCLVEDHCRDMAELRILIFRGLECNIDETLHNLRLLFLMIGRSSKLKMLMIETSEEASKILDRRAWSLDVSKSLKAEMEESSIEAREALVNSMATSNDVIEIQEDVGLDMVKGMEMCLSWDFKGHFSNFTRSGKALQVLHVRRFSFPFQLLLDIASTKSLLTFEASECPSLESIPEQFATFTSLKTLRLDTCGSLNVLPEEVGNLTSLTSLDLGGCSNLEALPEGVGNLTSLTSLDLGWCLSLRALPEGVENLTSLTSLSLGGCSSLSMLPKGVGNLTSLTSLDLEGCSSLRELPEGVGNLISLTSLSLGGCSSLSTLSEGVGNLTSLTSLGLGVCSSLSTLPEGVGNLTSLTSLSLGGCSSLRALPEGVGNLISLTSLDMWGCSSLSVLAEGVGNLTSLTSLDLGWCSSLRALSEGVGNLTSLTSLSLGGCSILSTLPEGVWNLTFLTSLRLERCSSLTTLPEGVGNLTLLTSLSLGRCSSLSTLPEGMGNLTALTSLRLERCSRLSTLPGGVGNLTSLASLDLGECSRLEALPEGVGNLISLTSLSLGGCSSLSTLSEGLGNLTSLASLDMWGCSSLSVLSEGVGKLTSLTSVDLGWCSSLRALPEGVGNLTSLTSLDLGWCSSLRALPKEVGNLTSLTFLNLERCSSLRALSEGVGNLTSLTFLNLEGCSSLRALPKGVGNLTSLTSLDLGWCSSLRALPEGVGNLTSLTSLDLGWCSSLRALPEGVGNLTSLTSLDLGWCASLRALPDGVWNLTSLTSLDLRGCSSLSILHEGVGNLTSLGSVNLKA